MLISGFCLLSLWALGDFVQDQKNVVKSMFLCSGLDIEGKPMWNYNIIGTYKLS